MSMPSNCPNHDRGRVTKGFDDEASISNSNSVLCDFSVFDKPVYLFSLCVHQVKRHRNYDRNGVVDSCCSGSGAVIGLEPALFFVPIEAKVPGISSDCAVVLFLSLFRCAAAQPFEDLVHHSYESHILFSGRFNSVSASECWHVFAFLQAVGAMKMFPEQPEWN